MAFAEQHIVAGLIVYVAGDGNLASGIPLSILSHWPLDDQNIGPVARIYHGVGTGWRRIIAAGLRGVLWAAIGYFFYSEPMSIAFGLSAWLVLDWEWLAGALLGRHGLGLHERMWPTWLHGEGGLFVLLGIIGLVLYHVIAGL